MTLGKLVNLFRPVSSSVQNGERYCNDRSHVTGRSLNPLHIIKARQVLPNNKNKYYLLKRDARHKNKVKLMIPIISVLSFSPQGQLKTWLGIRIHLSCHPYDESTLAEGSTAKNNVGERNDHSSYHIMSNSKHLEIFDELFVQALPNEVLESY